MPLAFLIIPKGHISVTDVCLDGSLDESGQTALIAAGSILVENAFGCGLVEALLCLGELLAGEIDITLGGGGADFLHLTANG